VLAIIGIVYGALVAMVQVDLKRLVAYSSVSHLGFVVLGIFAFHAISIQGAVFQMLSHGISTGALFLGVGHAVRPPAHALDQGIRRPGDADAGARQRCICLRVLPPRGCRCSTASSANS
jgi:NADH:ubiquinone oxidoreductase subunit 2 (subunit N)